MTNNKHTRGPWVAVPDWTYDRLEIRDKDGRRIAICMRDFPMSAAEHDANARLIAAAPELLAALEAAREFISDGMAMGFVWMSEDEDVLEVIEKANSKAKGGSK